MFFFKGNIGLCIAAVYYIDVETDESGVRTCKQKLELYQVQEQRIEVKRIADTGNITIFNGENYHYLAVRTNDWDLLSGGCKYDVCASSAGNDGDELSYGIYFIKVEGGHPETVVVGLAKMPPIWPHPPAMWFQPSLNSLVEEYKSCFASVL